MITYHRFQSEPWAITPEGIQAWQAVFRYEAPSATKSGKDFFGNDVPAMEVRDGLAIVPVSGPMIRAGGFLERGLGATVHGDVQAMIDAANTDAAVRAILLNVDSPGGTVGGTPELAASITNSRKPVYAFTSGQANSAAYYLAAGTKRIFATPSSSVGSIGVILSTTSIARALESSGVDVAVITSGAYKGTGHPASKLTSDQRDMLQERVTQSAGMFQSFVQKHRPGVAADAMQGQSFFAAEAKQRGLVDHVVGGIHEAIAMVRASAPATAPATTPTPAVQLRALSFEHLIAAGQFEAAWKTSPAAQAEFGSIGAFIAYHRAIASGRHGTPEQRSITIRAAQDRKIAELHALADRRIR